MRKNLKMMIALMMAVVLVITVTACTASAVGSETTEPRMEAVETTAGRDEDFDNQEDVTDATGEVTEGAEETEAPTEVPTEAEPEPEKETKPETEPAVEETKPQNGSNTGREEKEQDPTDPPATEPVVTDPPVTEPPEVKPTEPVAPVVPPVTEPPATEPPATEPPAPTECEHDWEIIYHPQEGYYSETYIKCACGARFSTVEEWQAHSQSYVGTEDISHCSWGGAREYIITVPRHYEYTCKKCGFQQIEYVD